MGKPTEKMINYIKNIITKFKLKEEEINKEIYEDFEKAKEFIDSFKDKFVLSDKQKEIVKKIDDNEVKELAKKNFLTKEEYEKVKNAIKNYFENINKLTEKQINVIKNNLDKFSEEVKEIIERTNELTKEEYEKVKSELDNFFKNLKK